MLNIISGSVYAKYDRDKFYTPVNLRIISWPAAFTACLCVLFICLGVWQLDRAEQKQGLEDSRVAAAEQDLVDLNNAVSVRYDREFLDWRMIQVRGSFVEEFAVLFDNRIVDSKVGYYVYQPLKLLGEEIYLLVNLGWVPAGNRRSEIPSLKISPDTVTVFGVAKQPQSAGVSLKSTPPEVLDDSIFRLQKVDIDEISILFGKPLLPYVLRLEEESEYGYTKKWGGVSADVSKHLAYAFQWFLMAVAVVIVFLYSARRAES